MIITNSVNPDKVILAADISEYNLLMIALMAFRDSAVDPSACGDCIDYAEALREHATEVVESLMDQEKNVPALAHDDSDSDESVPDWINSGDEEQENVV